MLKITYIYTEIKAIILIFFNKVINFIRFVSYISKYLYTLYKIYKKKEISFEEFFNIIYSYDKIINLSKYKTPSIFLLKPEITSIFSILNRIFGIILIFTIFIILFDIFYLNIFWNILFLYYFIVCIYFIYFYHIFFAKLKLSLYLNKFYLFVCNNFKLINIFIITILIITILLTCFFASIHLYFFNIADLTLVDYYFYYNNTKLNYFYTIFKDLIINKSYYIYFFDLKYNILFFIFTWIFFKFLITLSFLKGHYSSLKYWLVEGVTEEDILLERQWNTWVLDLLIAYKKRIVFIKYYKLTNNNDVYF